MAVKAALAAALLVALVAFASASSRSHTTTDNSRWPWSFQSCSQLVQGRQFRPCQRFLQQSSGGPSNDQQEEFGGQQQHLEECCEQLQDMDSQQCGCEAIRHAVRQVQQGGRSYQTGQSEQIFQRARELPRRCGLREQQCRLRLVVV